MMKIKQRIQIVLAIASLFVLFGCQTAKQPATSVKPDEVSVVAAKAYVRGFMQGDKAQYEAYYGEGSFDKEVEKQLLLSGATIKETADGIDLWKQMMLQSKKMYAKAEIVSVEKKDETTAIVKIKPIAVNPADRETWMSKKQDELFLAIQKGDEKALQRMKGLVSEVFEAIASGEIPSTVEAEETYEMHFVEKDGKLYPVDDLNTISSFLLKNKQ